MVSDYDLFMYANLTVGIITFIFIFILFPKAIAPNLNLNRDNFFKFLGLRIVYSFAGSIIIIISSMFVLQDFWQK